MHELRRGSLVFDVTDVGPFDGPVVVLLEVDAAFRHPVQFEGTGFIRIGSYKKRLKDFPEKERELWRTLDATPYSGAGYGSALGVLTAGTLL